MKRVPGGRTLGLVVVLVVGQAAMLAGIALATQPLIGGWHRGDLQLYQRAGQRWLQGQLPYRDFPLEYPPGALLAFAAPHLAAGRRLTLAGFTDSFLIQSIGLSTVIAVTLSVIAWRWWPGRPVVGVLGRYLAAVAVGAPVLAFRYDLLPAATTALALAGVLAGRPLIAGLCLGVGIAAKLYPAVILAVFGLAYLAQRRLWAAVALAAGAAAPVALAIAPFLSPEAAGWLGSLGFYGARGIQIETVPGGLLLAASALRLQRAGVTSAFAAYEVVSPVADLVARWQPALLVVGMTVVLALCWWRFRADMAAGGSVLPGTLASGLTLALLTFIITNKVFSAQHLIWLLPFAPLLPWRQGLLFLVAWALTNVLFPWHYEALTDGGATAVTILNLRNGAVLALIAWLALSVWRPAVARAPIEHPAA